MRFASATSSKRWETQLPIDWFLQDLHALWTTAGGKHLHLRVLGSTALFLQTTYLRGTKDSDIIETAEIDADTSASLLELAGKGSDFHRRHEIYLDVVGRTVPMLPPEPLWHHYPLRLERFEVHCLDVTDVVVSKLKRFNSNDTDDVRAMIEGDHVEHGRLIERFEEVVERYKFDGRVDRLPEMAERFNMAERDWFGVDETDFTYIDDFVR